MGNLGVVELLPQDPAVTVLSFVTANNQSETKKEKQFFPLPQSLFSRRPPADQEDPRTLGTRQGMIGTHVHADL